MNGLALDGFGLEVVAMALIGQRDVGVITFHHRKGFVGPCLFGLLQFFLTGRNKVPIDGTQITVLPTMESLYYNIQGTAFYIITMTGPHPSEEGEYGCSSYLTSNNQYVVDSDTITETVTIVTYPEGIKYYTIRLLYLWVVT